MAFRQPTAAPASRPTAAPVPERRASPSRIFLQTQALEDSREWVLFPSVQEDSAASYTEATPTHHTAQTAGLSRLSDFGSLNTGAWSVHEYGAGEATTGSLEDVEDEGIDSLDEGLHAFQEPSRLLSEYFHPSSNSILPRHDGLGGFPISTPALEGQESSPFDRRSSPRKRSFSHHRRRTSDVQRGLQETIDEDGHTIIEEERRERIEKWRLDHSRILLYEIEKETRKRRSSFTSQETRMTEQESSVAGQEGFGQIIRDELDERPTRSVSGASAITEKTETMSGDESESFWQRLTRRVIRDFIGVDDATLAVIFGESLPLPSEMEAITNGSPPSKAPRLDSSLVPSSSQSGSTWEKRLANRVARELGILLSQLSEHPGAFSTSPLINPITSDYAGMPITQPTSSRTHHRRSSLRSTTSAPAVGNAAVSPTSFTFNPTLQDAAIPPVSTLDSSHAALWGIEEETPHESEETYWESTPDFRTIVQRFLQNRFPSAASASTSHRRPSSPHNIATTTSPDSLRRAALIRQNHPLTNRSAAVAQHRRRRSLLRAGSSCASESARRSRVGKGSLSTSRNYWDLGGSSVASSGVGGGLGGWGEV